VETERAKRSLIEFVKRAWPLIEPARPLVWNWHLDAICSHLQAVSEGKLQKLIINVPPGSSKSSIVAVLWPCWEWICDPHGRWLFASHKDKLSERDSMRRRMILSSEWYQARWPLKFADDEKQKRSFNNEKSGYMISLSVGGDVTGFRGSRLVLDDPNSTTDMESDAERESSLMWFDLQWSTRGNPPCGAVIIQQRTHQSDFSGHALKQGGWCHLKIPMEYDGEKTANAFGWSDPRCELGVLLDEKRFPRKDVEALKVVLGTYGTAGQLQQEPVPRTGAIFKKEWMRRYSRQDAKTLVIRDKPILLEHVLRFMTVDPAASQREEADFTAIGVWGVHGQDLILLDLLRARLEGPDQVKAMQRLTEQWHARVIYVEPVAYQLTLLQHARLEGLPVLAIPRENVDRDKVSRAMAVTPLMEAGRFWLPDYAPWLAVYEEELYTFPKGDHDDCVDVTSYAGAVAYKIPTLMDEIPARRRVEEPDPDALSLPNDPYRGYRSLGM